MKPNKTRIKISNIFQIGKTVRLEYKNMYKFT